MAQPDARDLIRVIRELAKTTANVGWDNHAFDRVDERNTRSDVELSTDDALRILRLGDIDGGVRPGNAANEWIAKVIAPINHERGARNVGVVTVVIDNRRLWVITVEWEDRR